MDITVSLYKGLISKLVEFIVTTHPCLLNRIRHLPNYSCNRENKAGVIWEGVEAKAVKPPLTTTPTARASLSTLLLLSSLRTCFQGPHFLTGCLVWVTGCWLPVYWEGTDSKVKTRHPVECREEVAKEGWWCYKNT